MHFKSKTGPLPVLFFLFVCFWQLISFIFKQETERQQPQRAVRWSTAADDKLHAAYFSAQRPTWRTTCEHIHQLLFCCFSGLLLEFFFCCTWYSHRNKNWNFTSFSLHNTWNLQEKRLPKQNTNWPQQSSKARIYGCQLNFSFKTKTIYTLITGIDYLCPLIWAKTNIWQTIRTSSSTLQHWHTVTVKADLIDVRIW